MSRSAADRASDAADALLDWLGTQSKTPEPAVVPEPAPVPRAELAVREDRANDPPPAFHHVDWLHHRLTIEGPAEALAAFGQQACGAGVVPWRLDLDSLEEDWFHRLVSPPPPHRRSLSLAGARLLAGQLRTAVARRHEIAVARPGQSQACPFDLHALVPVPGPVLRLGPDHPDALAWLWEHWGTTQELRHVRMEAPGGQAMVVSFWSADWTPWRALQEIAGRWPSLRFQTRPTYETA